MNDHGEEEKRRDLLIVSEEDGGGIAHIWPKCSSGLGCKCCGTDTPLASSFNVSGSGPTAKPAWASVRFRVGIPPRGSLVLFKDSEASALGC
jgi:hypothetical protein